jgi:hypothetical protein
LAGIARAISWVPACLAASAPIEGPVALSAGSAETPDAGPPTVLPADPRDAAIGGAGFLDLGTGGS